MSDRDNMTNKEKISVVIITKNEASNIGQCVESANFANEILVLDSGSTDNTVQLAIDAGAKVIETDWPGFGLQKNRGIDYAGNDWIFSLDADERISQNLAKEILSVINKPEFSVFDVPRSSFFISKFMKHSGWSPDRTKRLFKKHAARFTDHQVHEHLETNQKIGHLKESLIHYSYLDVETVLKKINHYSSAGAIDLVKKGRKGSLSSAIGHGSWSFIRTYFIKLGFLDGKEGLILAIANAESSYYKHLKLYFLQSKKDLDIPN